MSIVFVIASEKQLETGIGWCTHLAAGIHAPVPIHVVVADLDRKTLAEYLKRKLNGKLNASAYKPVTKLLPKDAGEVLAYAADVSCKKLLLIYDSDQLDFQQQLFQQSMCAAIWVSANRPPPTKDSRRWAMFQNQPHVTDEASLSLFSRPTTEQLSIKMDADQEDLPAAVLAKLDAQSVPPEDLVLCGVREPDSSDPAYQVGLALLKQSPERTVAVLHTGHSPIEIIAVKVQSWAESVAPRMEREHRIELAKDLQTGSQPNFEYLALISASSMLAAFGLLQDSAAVIIGAMLIAPLMTPILGAGLALTQGNRPLFRSAILTITLGFCGALMSSIAFGWLFWIFREPTVTHEMMARSHPSPLDFCVGLVGGMAASYARTRTHLSSALAGAAIAAALVPPISTAGLQIAFGHWKPTEAGTPVLGPLLLVTANVLTIMIGSSFVLWARGMRSDRTLGTKDRWVLRVIALALTLALMVLIYVIPRELP